MDIYNVYDFVGPNGYFFNALDYSLIDDLHKIDFVFNNNTIDFLQKKHDVISSFSHEIFSKNNICVYDINNSNKNVIYFYNLHTNGNLKHFLGMNKQSETIRNSGFEYISETAINYLKNTDNFYITLYSGIENELDKYDIVNLYKECMDYNIPRNKIIFLSNILDSKKILNRFYNKFKIYNQKEFIFYNFNEQLLFKGDELVNSQNSNLFVSENLNINHKKNKCLFLNRRLRPHRLFILSLLANDNLLDNNLISFDLEYDDTSYFESYIRDNHYIRIDEYFKSDDIQKKIIDDITLKKVLNGFKIIKKINKKSLDVNNFNSIEGRSLEVDAKYLYENSYFSLVGETEFFDDWKDYTTEKILKPIQQLHPFVVVGRPHILKDLKSYGFKTFSEFWDESYDDEDNNSNRIKKVYSTIDNLINKSFLEWEDMYIRLKPILIHNKKVLEKYAGISTRKKIEKNIINLLSNESIQNHQRIL